MISAVKNLEFIGLDTTYECADGTARRRIHLDSAASPLACAAALKAINQLLPHYSNSHSYVHNSARISTKAYDQAHKTVLDFLQVNDDEYAAVFTGSGSTGAINRIARGLHRARPNRSVVLVSAMEHHANDLPHRQFENQVVYVPLTGSGADSGAVDLNALEQLCHQYRDTLNYVAISSVSNVTGIRNPITEVCRIAHQYGALVVVDAAQSVAHRASHLDDNKADFMVFSGHKVYTPMAPGVMVAKRSLLSSLDGQDLGGGAVTDVSPYDFTLTEDVSAKEEAGTPNIVGAVALAASLDTLQKVGIDVLREHQRELMAYLIQKLKKNKHIKIYGDLSLERIGALSFNHKHIEHGLLAAILNDYYAIAVRNDCFCAHPYVSAMLKEELWEIDLGDTPIEQHQLLVNQRRGMVRASISAYTCSADIDALCDAIIKIEDNLDQLRGEYLPLEDGSWQHRSFSLDWRKSLSPA